MRVKTLVLICLLFSIPAIAELSEEEIKAGIARHREIKELPPGKFLQEEVRLIDAILETGYPPGFNLGVLNYVERASTNDMWSINKGTPPFERRFLRRLQGSHSEHPAAFLDYIRRVLKRVDPGDVEHSQVQGYEIWFETLRQSSETLEPYLETISKVMEKATESGVSTTFNSGLGKLYNKANQKFIERFKNAQNCKDIIPKVIPPK